MAAPYIRVSFVRIVSALFLLLIALVTAPANAIQLRWSTGAADLTTWQDTQAMLIVQADSSEGALPNSWRLQWTADSLGLEFSPFEYACLVDTAKVDSVVGPTTPADSAANQVTAYFCSSGGDNATTAYYLVDLPAGGHGKLKVVALDPADPDSNTVISSNEVTYNGGVEGEYAPAVLRVTTDHSTTILQAEIVGADLEGVETVSVSASELLTDIPLAMGSRGSLSLHAEATIAIPLPNSQILVGTARGVVASGTVAADVVEATEVPDEAYFSDPAFPDAYPKDFAFINAPTPVGGVWRNLFHIFYIRAWNDDRPDSTNEVSLGHAWSRDLVHWEYTANSLDAFHANTSDPTAWDHQHVWAPSIVQFGTKFLMFYTGVAENGDQTIGYASADSIYTTSPSSSWVRQGTFAHSPPQSAGQWVSPNHPWQFRDPFVMPDPQSPATRLLMFYTAKTAADSGNAVGVARSAINSAASWTDLGYYPNTTIAHTLIGRLESPHVFPDSIHQAPGQNLSASWRLMFTMGDWNFPDSTRIVFFETKVVGTDITDRATAHWSATPTNLYDYLHLTGTSPEYGHQASEMLNVGGTYFWAGFDGADIRFRRVLWGGSTHFWLANVGQFVGVPSPAAPKQLRLAMAGLSPSHGQTRFRIEMPARMRVSLAIYDVAGRRVRSLVDRELPSGSTDVTWDGRDQNGLALDTGMYFARMIAAGGSRVLRVPLVR